MDNSSDRESLGRIADGAGEPGIPGDRSAQGDRDPAETNPRERKRRPRRKPGTRSEPSSNGDVGHSMRPGTESVLTQIAEATKARDPADDSGRAAYPRLFELLSKRFDGDGRLIRPASITVKCEGEVWQASVSVPWAKVSCTVAVLALEDLLETVEQALGSNATLWRLQRGFKIKKD